MNSDEFTETDVAIVGMAGRFPGADDVDELWRRVVAGEDCLTSMTAREAMDRGARPNDVLGPDYVLRSGELFDVAGFDHEFFGISSRDADVMDPQHRHFLECAWSALEMSTNVPERFDGSIGVFGGCGMNTYLVNNLLTAPGLLDRMGWFLLRHTGNDKDFFVNNVAYRLDLHGPAVNVQTACSTSLVAVHLAVQSLLTFECDLALAGGATIEVPHGVGYRYHDGEITSADGRCRAFDERSAGTVLTSGVAVVALRRAADAMADGDPILAVINATAINNDGARKVGFLAPSVDGHADVVREALTVADLTPEDIQLVEAHGTGTAIGDPIEVAALTEAFRTFSDASGFCRLTSTKPNVGHLDTAAGAASLIKVVQALRHKTLPPMANHSAPSPLVDWGQTPFTVTSEASEWPRGRPRRAGVSSLGVGGTNAHVIVQEAPPAVVGSASAAEQVLILSAASEASLTTAADRLAQHLQAHPDEELADVSHTLITGRRHLSYRRAVTATDVAAAAAILRRPDRHRSVESEAGADRVRLGFMFPGGGSHYPGMGARLDDRFQVFHDVRAAGARAALDLGGIDVSGAFGAGPDDDELRLPTRSLPAVFITSVALARQWMAFGAEPDVLLGHSLGEYVAAHLAGVLSFEDVLTLVIARARLMERVGGPDTGMLVVPLGEERVIELLPEQLSLATINASDECVVAGRSDEIERFVTALRRQDVTALKVPLAAAAHSSLLDPVLDEFGAVVRSVTLSRPTIAYPSNLTGTWVLAEQATDPDYWVDHLRGTVRFHDAVRTVCEHGPTVLTELGPGQSLTAAARRTTPGPVGVAPALRHPDHDIDDTAFTLQAYARAWAYGADVRLEQLPGPGRAKIVLPTYAFDHTQHWIDPGVSRLDDSARESPTAVTPATSDARVRRRSNLDEFTWVEEWVEVSVDRSDSTPTETWVVTGDKQDLRVNALVASLRACGATVRPLGWGSPLQIEEPTSLVLLVPEGGGTTGACPDLVAGAAELARTLGSAPVDTRLIAVTCKAFAVEGSATNPTDAIVAGVVKVADQEYDGLTARVVDIDEQVSSAELAGVLLDVPQQMVALRSGRLLAPQCYPLAMQPVRDVTTIRDGGVYLVTGALGGVGHAIAEHLARDRGAHLVLLSREAVPSGLDRDRWLAKHGREEPTSRRIRRLVAIERHGTKVEVVVADTSYPASVLSAVEIARIRFGGLDGAIHAAGVMNDQLLALASDNDLTGVIAPKVAGATALADALRGDGQGLLVLIGSTSTVLAPPGQAAYVGANTVLDQMAGSHGDLRIVTIDYGLWAVDGMATAAARRTHLALDAPVPFTHPVLDTMSDEGAGRIVLAGRIAPDHHWVVDEHRLTDGAPVLPGTAHLDLMFTSAIAAGIDLPVLEEVMLLEPVVVLDGTSVGLRVTVETEGDARVQIDRDDDGRWTAVSMASIGTRSPTRPPTAQPTPVAVTDPLGAQRSALRLGPRWNDAVASAQRGDRTAQVHIRLADTDDALAGWHLHPAVADLCTAAAVAIAPERSDGSLWAPVRYQQVVVPSPLPLTVVATAVIHSDESTDDRVVADISVVDEHGHMVMTMNRLELRALSGDTFAPRADPRGPAATRSLADRAMEYGLTSTEGVELFRRIVASGHDRVIATSLHLDDLVRLEREKLDNTGSAVRTRSNGHVIETVDGVVAGLWTEMLGLDEAGPDDDFFDLGGHSLLAIRVMTYLQRRLQVRLELSDILTSSTVATLASRIREIDPSVDSRIRAGELSEIAGADTGGVRGPDAKPRHLVALSTSGPGRPLYVVHGAGGNVVFLWSLARAMSRHRPIYGFQARGVDGTTPPDESIEEMASRYIADLQDHSAGPYLLAGFSGGGLVTLEMARQLRELGEHVDIAVLFDSAPHKHLTPTRRERWQNICYHARRGRIRSVISYIRQILQWRVTVIAHSVRPVEVNQEHATEYVDLYSNFTLAADNYVIGRYEVDVLLVKADEVWPSQTEDYHWGDYIDGTITIATCPGDHLTMFSAEHAPLLATRVEQILARFDR